MITKYKYKEKVCSTLYELSEILGKDGVFIPLSIGDEALAELGVTVPTVPFYTSDGWDNESITGTGSDEAAKNHGAEAPA